MLHTFNYLYTDVQKYSITLYKIDVDVKSYCLLIYTCDILQHNRAHFAFDELIADWKDTVTTLWHHFSLSSHFPSKTRCHGEKKKKKPASTPQFLLDNCYLKMHDYYCAKELTILFVLENWMLESHLAHVEIILFHSIVSVTPWIDFRFNALLYLCMF